MQAQALPPVVETEAILIRQFLERSWAENGLARTTQESYRHDLEGLSRWLQERRSNLLSVKRRDLFDYLSERREQNYAARSNARMLSALRSFYSQQLRFAVIEEDPTALLELPKLRKGLPKALSESEVEALLNCPEVAAAIRRYRTHIYFVAPCSVPFDGSNPPICTGPSDDGGRPIPTLKRLEVTRKVIDFWATLPAASVTCRVTVFEPTVKS